MAAAGRRRKAKRGSKPLSARPRRADAPIGPAPAIVTFLSDFGTSDAYVAAMKAAVLAHCGGRSVHLIDVSHQILPQDVLCGSIVLERAVASFPEGTIHVAVVDPGVGTDRRLLAVSVNGQIVLCPDNGLITWTWRRHGGDARELIWRPKTHSNTFHGRDILAPAAGMIAGGTKLNSLSRTFSGPLLLDLHLAQAQRGMGVVIHFDHYGNATTNVPAQMCEPDRIVQLGTRRIGRVRVSYGSVEIGEALALIGSSDLLEVAVRNGSARDVLGLKLGDTVKLVD